MKNVLLVDTSFSALPIFNSLVADKYKVFTIGNNNKDCLTSFNNTYHQLDYSDHKALISFCKKMKIDFIVPGCNDQSYLSSANASSLFKNQYIDSFKNAQKINNKNEFRKIAKQINLSTPDIYSKDNYSAPYIIKPEDSYSGQGVTVLSKYSLKAHNKAKKLALKFSKSKKYLIEEFIEGQLYSHSAFLKNNKIQSEFIVKEFSYSNPFAVDTSFVDNLFPKNLLIKIKSEIELLSKELKLCDGLIHTQFILKKNNIFIIEITRRCPGDLYSELVELSTGYEYAKIYSRHFVNKKIDYKKPKRKFKHIVRHTVTFKNETLFHDISFNTNQKIIKFVPLCTTGALLSKSPKGRMGIVFFECQNEEARTHLLSQIKCNKLYNINT